MNGSANRKGREVKCSNGTAAKSVTERLNETQSDITVGWLRKTTQHQKQKHGFVASYNITNCEIHGLTEVGFLCNKTKHIGASTPQHFRVLQQ